VPRRRIPASQRPRSGSAARRPVDPAYLRDLFSHSARYYDAVNVVTSLGQVSRWRSETIRLAGINPGDCVLDAFCGPGGLSEKALPHLDGGRAGGELVLADLSPAMLHEARRRLASPVRPSSADGARLRITFVSGDLLAPMETPGRSGFPRELVGRSFDVILLGWGLRYVPDDRAALIRMRELLRPGGRLAILEFTRPIGLGWATPAHLYFRHVVPLIGSWLAHDRELHDYLQVSAANFLDADELERSVAAAGLEPWLRKSHLGGLVTVLVARRPVS
jgi:demethylmenaquinone methyltransferase/2-methoxy-6-polyprenyl-1,4-benzoquinol methylase